MIAKRENVELKIFLMGDAVISSVNGQKVPAGYYNAQIMLSNPIKWGAVVSVCVTAWMPAEFREAQLNEGVHRGSMEELTDWILWADNVISY